MEAIKTVGLTKRYGAVTAVDGLDLAVEAGTLFSLLGVNGAGKTTTIRMLSGLTRPTAGDAFLAGKSICKEPMAAKKLLAVSPQETAVAPKLTVLENLLFMAGVYGFSKKQGREQADRVISELELTEVLGRKAGKLSGGWQRRLSIAMALISQPEILFLDEPTLGLDVLARSELWNVIRSLKGRATIVLTTHYMEEAEELSDQIGIMRSGKLLCTGTAESLKQRTGTDRFEEAFIRIVKEEQP